MPRVAFTLIVSLVVAAWAGAQVSAPALNAADELRLLRANRILLEDLVDDGLQMSSSNGPVERAEACQKTARTLANALRRAADDSDPDRVVELADHLDLLIKDGLAPNLEETKGIPPGSPDGARVKKLRQTVLTELDDVRTSLSTPGQAGDNRKLDGVRDRFEGLRERLK